MVIGVAVVLLLVAISIGAYWYTQKADPKNEMNSLRKELSKVIELPDELPTLATVSDVSKLANQPFFMHAQNGDKVLIYPIAQKAFLYRPSTKKIIDVGPVNINQPTTVPGQVTPAPTISGTVSEGSKSAQLSPTTSKAPVEIAIYNGTTRTGLTKEAMAKIEKRPGYTVVKRTDAAKSDYTETVVIDLSGGSKTMFVNQLASDLGAKVATLPKGETKPTADILVILGQNYK
jgi:hypothetical protein